MAVVDLDKTTGLFYQSKDELEWGYFINLDEFDK